MEEERKEVFDELFKLNVNEHVEKKNTGKVSLSYLSWSWAWAEVIKRNHFGKSRIVFSRRFCCERYLRFSKGTVKTERCKNLIRRFFLGFLRGKQLVASPLGEGVAEDRLAGWRQGKAFPSYFFLKKVNIILDLPIQMYYYKNVKGCNWCCLVLPIWNYLLIES